MIVKFISFGRWGLDVKAILNDAMPFFWIYGHVHGTDMYKTITKNTACISVERWDYTPIELERIIELAKLI